MPAPLTFAVEFSTAGAAQALKSLVSDVRSVTGVVENILAPLSPTNLVTQIAQQGLGINALGSNLVNGGIGALANSRFGYLTQMGAQFTAESNAFSQTQNDVRQFAQFGLPQTDEMMRFTYQMNLAQSKAAEQADLRLKALIGPDVAAADAKFAKSTGTKFFRENVESNPFYQGAMSFLDEIQHPLRGLDALGSNLGANLFNSSNWRASALSR